MVVDVGVSDVGSDQGFVDEGFDDGGVDTDRHVAFDSLFGPVPEGSKVEEVFQGPEPRFDVEELPVGGNDPGGRGLSEGEAGGEHIPPRELFFVGVGRFVVVIGEPGFADLTRTGR